VKSPIGLFIPTETPKEIAISIMAEIIDQYNQMKKHFQRA
jgi:xanthine/CO dehydrogenase XdhC/CoxF family maturation factor